MRVFFTIVLDTILELANRAVLRVKDVHLISYTCASFDTKVIFGSVQKYIPRTTDPSANYSYLVLVVYLGESNLPIQ